MKQALERAEPGDNERWESDSLYQDICEEASKARPSVGPDGCVRAANRHALELLAHPVDEVVRRPVLDLCAGAPAGKGKAHRLVLRLRVGAELCGEELEMRGADGTPVCVSLFARPVPDAEDHVTGSTSIVEEMKECKEPQYPSKEGNLRLEPSDNDAKIALWPAVFLQGSLERERLKRLVVKAAGRIHLFKAEQIDWIKAAGNYAEVHVGQKTHLLRATMSHLEATLNPGHFLRIHRSAIVNIERIKELQPGYSGDYRVLLQDGTQLTLSRSYRKGLQSLVGNLL